MNSQRYSNTTIHCSLELIEPTYVNFPLFFQKIQSLIPIAFKEMSDNLNMCSYDDNRNEVDYAQVAYVDNIRFNSTTTNISLDDMMCLCKIIYDLFSTHITLLYGEKLFQTNIPTYYKTLYGECGSAQICEKKTYTINVNEQINEICLCDSSDKILSEASLVGINKTDQLFEDFYEITNYGVNNEQYQQHIQHARHAQHTPHIRKNDLVRKLYYDEMDVESKRVKLC